MNFDVEPDRPITAIYVISAPSKLVHMRRAAAG
jgi:hypothetical protein